MGHIYAFIVVMAATSGFFGYIDWLTIKHNWDKAGDLTFTFAFAFHVAIFVWSTTLLLKVFPKVPLC